MSMENFSEQWPTDAPLEVYVKLNEVGVDMIEHQFIMPDHDAYRIGYTMLNGGGQKAAVLAVGAAGAGKTLFGNTIIGSRYRVDIVNEDREDTLFGFQHPFDETKRLPGKFNGKLTKENPRFYANELPDMRNTGALHKAWDAGVIEINGELIPLKNGVFYAAGNFPDANRVNTLDAALRSRFAVELLFGNMDDEHAEELHGQDLGASMIDEELTSGMLPNPAARENLRGTLIEAYTLDARAFGGYVLQMIKAVNANPMLQNISKSDNRLSEGWQQAVRAQLFLEGAKSTKIGARDAAKVAALVLPTQTSLSQKGKSELLAHLGPDVLKVDPATEAVVRRRLLAGMAFKAVEAKEAFPQDNIQQHRDNFRDQYSFVTKDEQTDKIDAFVEQALGVNPNETGQPAEPVAHKRRLFGRR